MGSWPKLCCRLFHFAVSETIVTVQCWTSEQQKYVFVFSRTRSATVAGLDDVAVTVLVPPAIQDCSFGGDEPQRLVACVWNEIEVQMNFAELNQDSPVMKSISVLVLTSEFHRIEKDQSEVDVP